MGKKIERVRDFKAVDEGGRAYTLTLFQEYAVGTDSDGPYKIATNTHVKTRDGGSVNVLTEDFTEFQVVRDGTKLFKV